MTLLNNIVNVCYVLYFSMKLPVHVAYITILLRTSQIHLCAVVPSLTNYTNVIAFVHNMGYRKLRYFNENKLRIFTENFS